MSSVERQYTTEQYRADLETAAYFEVNGTYCTHDGNGGAEKVGPVETAWADQQKRRGRSVLVDGPMTGEQVTQAMQKLGIPSSLEREQSRKEQRAARPQMPAREWEGFGR